MHAKKNRQKYFTAFVIVGVFLFILFQISLIFAYPALLFLISQWFYTMVKIFRDTIHGGNYYSLLYPDFPAGVLG